MDRAPTLPRGSDRREHRRANPPQLVSTIAEPFPRGTRPNRAQGLARRKPRHTDGTLALCSWRGGSGSLRPAAPPAEDPVLGRSADSGREPPIGLLLRGSQLALTLQQLPTFRSGSGPLDERMPMGSTSLPLAAWAGLQAAACRAPRCFPCTRGSTGSSRRRGRHPSLAQLWGPRYNAYRPEARLRALLAREAPHTDNRLRAERTGRTGARAARRRADDRPRARTGARDRQLVADTPRRRARSRSAGTARGRPWPGRSPRRTSTPPTRAANSRAATSTSSGLPRLRVSPAGPGSRRSAAAAFASLEGSLLPVRTPLGDEWLLVDDEPAARRRDGRRARPSAP